MKLTYIVSSISYWDGAYDIPRILIRLVPKTEREQHVFPQPKSLEQFEGILKKSMQLHSLETKGIEIILDETAYRQLSPDVGGRISLDIKNLEADGV